MSSDGVKRLLILLVACLVTVAMTSTPTFSQLIINETFEQDVPQWPWPTGDDTQWEVRPDPPGRGPFHTWGKEDSVVWHFHGEDSYRAIWCAGLPNDLDPDSDTYPENMDAWAFWGPFDMTEDMLECGGFFYYHASMEPYYEGAGDNFAVLVTDNYDNVDQRLYENCCVAYHPIDGTTDGRWQYMEIDFAELDSAGEEVSYMPFQDENGDWHLREDIYVAFVFQSNGNSNELHSGVWVDDFNLSAFDGMYDFKIENVQYQDPDDSTEYQELHASDPIQFYVHFKVIGPGEPVEASHILYVDTDLTDDEDVFSHPVDTMHAAWENHRYGEVYERYFSSSWTPAPEDTGLAIFAVKLDAPEEVEESNEENNTIIDTVEILQAQSAPYIVWIRPGSEEDTIRVTEDSTWVTVIYEAYNSPDFEWAEVSFYYDDNMEGYDGVPIRNAQMMRVLNGEDSFTWDCEELENRTYWIYATLNDNWFPMVYDYNMMPVIVDIAGSPEDQSADIPRTFTISSLYPNPFNPSVEVTVAVPRRTDLALKWYSVDGRLVDEVRRDGVAAGYHAIRWAPPQSLASGVYFLSVESSLGTCMAKTLFLK